MKVKWGGLACVAILVVAVIALKQRGGTALAEPVGKGALSSTPSVLLVADLREANDKCICGEMIRAVRAAGKRGLPVTELTPESRSDLLKRYRVLTAPAVLILDRSGHEVSRYEGETQDTLTALNTRLDEMTGVGKTR
jgi:hypothetical protein